MAEEQAGTHLKRCLTAISVESIISGFQAYREIFGRVLQSPRRYAYQNLLPWKPRLLQSAISTFLYGVAISFLLYVPLIQKHRFELGKLHFLLQFAYFQLLLVCVVHLAAKIFRGSGTLAQTATTYCIWSGIAWPILLVISYPVFFYMPVEDFILSGTGSSLDTESLPPWVMWWNAGVFLLMSVIGFVTLFQWIADVHQITKRRLLLAMILVYFPIMILHNLVIAPYTSIAVRLTSDFLKNLF